MIGDGPYRLEAEQLCRKLGVSQNVKFLRGITDENPEYKDSFAKVFTFLYILA